MSPHTAEYLAEDIVAATAAKAEFTENVAKVSTRDFYRAKLATLSEELHN